MAIASDDLGMGEELSLEQQLVDLEVQRLQLAILNEFARSLITIPTIERLLWHVAKEVVMRLGFVDCVIYRADLKPDHLVQVAATGIKNPQAEVISNQLTIPFGKGITGTVASTGQAMIIDDLQDDERYIADLEDARSEICLPIVVNDVVFGVLDCEDPEIAHFDDHHLEILSTVVALTETKITDCLNTERLKKQAEVLQHISEIIIIFDADGTVIDCNERFLEAYRQTRSDVIGTNAFELYARHSGSDEKWDIIRQDVLSSPPWDGNITILDEDANRTIYNLSINPWQDDQDEQPLFVAVGREVTKQVEAETSLQERNDALQEMSFELTEALEQSRIAQRTQAAFMANVSHELRTPLNAIVGFSDIMRSPGFLETSAGKALEYTNYIHSAGNHLTELVNDILDISSLAAKKTVVHTVQLSPGEGIDHVVTLLQSKADQKGTRLTFTNGAPEGQIGFDERHFKQIMTNLIDNAIKYSPERSRVDVRLSENADGQLVIEVEDNGQGIATTQLDAIFTPFSRADWAKAQEVEGAGLGLALVKELVGINDATIDVTSALGEGSTFTVTIPPLATLSEGSKAFLQAGQF